MKDLKEIKIDPIISEERYTSLQRKYYPVVQNDLECQEFISRNHLSEKKVLNYLSIFLRFIESKKECQNCLGYASCKNNPKGTCLNLLIDSSNAITLGYKKCDKNFLTDELESRYLIHDFPFDNLQYSLISTLSDDYREVRIKAVRYLGLLSKGEKKKGIYLYGGHLLGKSFILSIFSKVYIEQSHGKVAFVNTADYMQYLVSMYYQSNNDFKQLLNDLINVDLLILDDFGNEYVTAYYRDNILYPLLSCRLNNGKITCFSSNYDLKQIGMIYSLKEKNSPKGKQIQDIVTVMSESYQLTGLPFIN